MNSLFDKVDSGFEVSHDVFKRHVKNVNHHVVKFLTTFNFHDDVDLHLGRTA